MSEPEQENQDVTVLDNPEKGRFDVTVDGAHAGFSLYQDTRASGTDQRIFYHTVIFDDFEGRGLAGILTKAALGTSVQSGHRLVAVCPYVKKWVSTHHDYSDSLDPVGPEHLDALR
ncbi:GNAT family N-acetyltransferase [Citricoccus sp.]|uniref:GNAT family N-acetyltransferase n=1 Tax=Citricoccus sp. TaxID=1978372 RepID=UPI0028BEE642|nr:GNAT family N-acetyltransferase [Citricoccus sp.]